MTPAERADYRALAERYGVSQETIRAVRRGERAGTKETKRG